MRVRIAVPLVVMLLVAAGCTADADESETPSVVVGVGSTTEQRVLGALTVVALDRSGVTAELRPDLGSTVGLRREALRGGIELYWDYTGAAWALGLGQEGPPADPQESWERMAQTDLENGLLWLEPTRANATLALFVRAGDLPPETEPRGMTWLAGVLSAGGEGARLCADPDFLSRPGGLDALLELYVIAPDALETVPATEDEAVEAVAAGRCFAGLATATSGKARNAGLARVAYDRLELVFPPAFVVAPVVRGEVLERVDLASVLAPVTGRLDTETLAALNAATEAGADPGVVAEDFLADLEPVATGG